MIKLDIYRGKSVWLTIKTDDNTRKIQRLLGGNIIKSSFNSHIFLDINIGDFIVYDGVIYHINNLPTIKKNSTNSYDYNVTFESESYELLKTQFLDNDGNSDFYLVGNLETFIDLIVYNMGREHTGWVKGTWNKKNDGEDWPSALDYKLLSFSKNNCMQVLQKLCVEFEGEFYLDFALDFTEGAKLPYIAADSAVVGYKPAAEAEHGYKPAEFTIHSYTKNICFTDKVGEEYPELIFKYKQGLRNIHRTTLSEKNIITRLYAFGSRKNLKSDYREYSRRLKFVVDEKSYLESNTDKYGTIEHTEIFNDIYPHREGTISSVDLSDITKFKDINDPAMFDLNEHLLPGVTAKVHFNSGDLGGYEFEISHYNHATKEFTIIPFRDDQGYVMPNATLKPAVGNKYVLIDIFLPDSYITTAEDLLEAKAQTYLDDNCEPRVTYILEPDWRYFKEHFIKLKAGDFIKVEDDNLGINVMTRIVELTKSVANEYKYTLKLTDHLEVQLIQRLYSDQEDLKRKVEIGYGGDIIRARRSWRTSEELRTMVFDTDGYFDMENIRPLSVQTGMLSVGTKSTQYILKGIQVWPNYDSDVNKFYASGGELIHLSIADDIRTWTIFENLQPDLADEAYYIYAECTKEEAYSGHIVVDLAQKKFDDNETYYYFLIGVLHKAVDGVREISLTYGQTIINGKFIRTGKIESTNGLVYFDLDNNTLMLPDGSITAGKIVAGAITAIKIAADAIETNKIKAGNVTADKIAAGAITVNKIASNAITAIKIAANAIETLKIKAGAVTADRIASNAITAIKINADAVETNKIKAGAVTADKIEVDSLAAIKAVLGTVHAGLIYGTRIQVGGGADEDILFEDSGVRVYDVGSRSIGFSKSGYAEFTIMLVAAEYIRLNSSTDFLIVANSKGFRFRTTGTLTLPTLASAPAGHTGDLAFDDGDQQTKLYTQGAWRHHTTSADW